MSPYRAAAAIALSVAAGAGTLGAVQRPRFPPPPTTIYDFMDLGPAPTTACTCVPNAFALPSYRPGWGYGQGPATPGDDAPLSDADRRINAAWYAEETKGFHIEAANGLEGNPNDSLTVVQNLQLHRAIFGPDDHLDAEAVRWLTLAAQQGHQDAFRMLGQTYAHGWGVKPDQTMAAYWFDQGARHDDPISMTAIGFLFAAGRGVVQDWGTALAWWRRAETRTPLAARFLGDAYACGAGVRENHERALAAYRQFAKMDPSSSIQIGHMYVKGCAPPDDAAAVAAFRNAADQGYPDAQVELSDLLWQGRGTEPNPLEAYLWARLAERRLPSGDLKTRASARVAAARRLLSEAELAAEDRMIDGMLAEAAKPIR
jgi:TPR repeat protein